MTFSLAKNGVRSTNFQKDFESLSVSQDRPVPELVAATGYGYTGGFTLLQVVMHFHL